MIYQIILNCKSFFFKYNGGSLFVPVRICFIYLKVMIFFYTIVQKRSTFIVITVTADVPGWLSKSIFCNVKALPLCSSSVRGKTVLV